MPKVDVGDLVCLYRRKSKGLGIVIEKIEDVEEELQLSTPLEDVLKNLSSMDKYTEKTEYREKLVKLCDNPKVARIFFMYNGLNWCKKPKYKFVRVRWFKRPSAYESMMREEENWCPQDWLKKV